MMRGSTYLVGLLVALAAIFAAGCGGTDDESAPPALTKAAFLKQGDAICAKADKEQESKLFLYAKQNPGTLKDEAGQVKLILAAGLPPLQKQTEELAELTPPEADAEEVEEIITGFEAAIEKSREEPSELLNGVGAFASVTKLAEDYGFKVCSSVT